MGILLVHEGQPHKVALSEGKVAGEHTLARIYEHEGKFLHVGGADHIAQHDAEEILRIPGYHLATAKEQQEYVTSKRQEQQITESVEEPAKTGRRHK